MTIHKPRPNKGRRVGLDPAIEKIDYNREKPTFSLQFIDPEYCITCCDKDEKASFADMLRNMSQMTWNELRNAPRHGMGSEKIDQKAIKQPIPQGVTEDVTFLAFRFHALKPMVGYRVRETFHIIWFDRNFTLYDHG